VIAGAGSSLPVRILDAGDTVALTTHVACEEGIKAVKTRITRNCITQPYHATRAASIISMMKAGGILRTGYHHVAFEAALAATVRSIYRIQVTVAGLWTETSTGVSRGSGKA
jgi:hypothetical protein